MSHGTRSDHSEPETQDLEQDEDDFVLPPGVMLVTAAIDDLPPNEQALHANNVSSPNIGKAI